jgi:hypothetical protein
MVFPLYEIRDKSLGEYGSLRIVIASRHVPKLAVTLS